MAKIQAVRNGASVLATISKTNNISDIQAFLNEIDTIAQQYPISIVANYVQQLNSHIDSFDIGAIKQSQTD